uniref:Uncharacterized protein n=1 Tax=Pinguiococcus pyrenoidosus TaxID=172671 RepID=A0A7R9YE97_9STRA|mmetsp:Transcript_6254/g.24373  ORF Transcript_6254/g.24373 Transcript_6254/m.24373 type:complete len:104 (+) Transcript_6254:64-375(+)
MAMRCPRTLLTYSRHLRPPRVVCSARFWTFSDSSSGLPVDLEEKLGCPFTKKPVRFDETQKAFVSDEAGVAWPLGDDKLPDFLPWSGKFLDDNGKIEPETPEK